MKLGIIAAFLFYSKIIISWTQKTKNNKKIDRIYRKITKWNLKTKKGQPNLKKNRYMLIGNLFSTTKEFIKNDADPLGEHSKILGINRN